MTDKKTILIVDDELDMRIFLTTLFETSGYQPVAVRDGHQGIQKARQVHPDAILLDVMMPGEGGVTMYRELKADPQLRDIPVIMLSGVAKEAFLHYLNMLNIQADDPICHPEAYVEKPPDPEMLRQLVERTISK